MTQHNGHGETFINLLKTWMKWPTVHWCSSVPKASLFEGHQGQFLCLIGVGLEGAWLARDVYFVWIKCLLDDIILNFKKNVKKKKLNGITLSGFGIDSVSVTGSETTDSLLSLLAVASGCWSMDSMIGSVCTQNVKWETHLKGEASFYLLSAVFCSQELLDTIYSLIFLAGSCLAPVSWPLLMLWSMANYENGLFFFPRHICTYIFVISLICICQLTNQHCP